LAQTGGLLVASAMESTEGKLFLFTGLDKVKFRKQVTPGDKLELVCSNLRMKLALCKMEAKAYVDGKVVCEAELTAAVGNRPAA
jgi:3-hydroxyacyl-[acyl-carrier-protein] dehydratase